MLLVTAACSTTQGVPDVDATPEPDDGPAVGARVPGELLSSGQAALAIVSVSPVVPGRTASATLRYGYYQTCHAQVVYADRTSVPLGTYESGFAESPTWQWDVDPTAPSSGIFTVTCGTDLFHVPFTATGGGAAGSASRVLTPTVIPWPTPLSCSTSLKGC